RFHRRAGTPPPDRPGEEPIRRNLEEPGIRQVNRVAARRRVSMASLAMGCVDGRSPCPIARRARRKRDGLWSMAANPCNEPRDGILPQRPTATRPICGHRRAWSTVDNRAPDELVARTLEERSADERGRVVRLVTGRVGAVAHGTQ